MKHNKITLGDVVITKKNIGKVTRVTWSGGDKHLHITSETGKVFPIHDNDVRRLVKRKK